MITTRIYGFNKLSGSSEGALGRIPLSGGESLNDGDMAFGIVSGQFYCYTYSADSTETESEPDVISPSDDSGRWLLATV